MNMTTSKPYLIRSINEWIIDNGMTPHLLVDTSISGTIVPEQFVEDNKVVLNIALSATQSLVLGNELISFSARFSGKPYLIQIPIPAVRAIYARENGKGIAFDQSEVFGEEPDTTSKPAKPTLTLVK